MPRRAGFGRRGRGSSRRAASYRNNNALLHLREQVSSELKRRGSARQRFDHMRQSTNATPWRDDNTLGIGNNDINSMEGTDGHEYSTLTAELRESERDAMAAHYSKMHVPRVGFVPQPRPHGVFRWMYCQVNGLVGDARTRKIKGIWDLAEQYDVDGIALVEVGVNWKYFRSSARLSSWIEPLSSREIRTTVAFNTQAPAVSAKQQGGTAIVLRHGLIQYGQQTTPDSSGLGRWTSWVLSTNPSHRTRVVVAYCPGKSGGRGPGTVHTQHLTEINNRGLNCSPYQFFVEGLTAALRAWRAAGDRLLLFIDSNEHVLTGRLASLLKHPSLELHEVSHFFWNPGTEHNTHINGTKPIDGIYASPEIDVQSFLSLSFHEGVGDHRTSIMDISTASMVGVFQGHIVRPTSRRLTTKQAGSVATYNSILWSQLQSHNVPKRWESVAEEAAQATGVIPADIRLKAEQLHTEIKEHRIHAERVCRNILKPASPFSLPIQFWYDRIHAFKQLIRLIEGKHPGMGRSRVYRTARRKKIINPEKLSIADCREGIRLSKIQQREVRKQDAAHRRNHLGSCLQSAMDSGDEQRTTEIKARMRNEHNKSMWSRINRVTRQQRGRACMQVEVTLNGRTQHFNTKDEVELAIQGECEQRFRLGHSAPITNSLLGHQLRYMEDPDIAEQVLNGTYIIPDDVDPGTALMLMEMGRMGRLVQAGSHRDITNVTSDDYKQYGRRLKENTSSSPSGLHHGHDKAASQCDKLASFFAFQMTTIVQTGLRPARWGVALQVMLEKIAGVCLVDKLRSIQLYEADYNWFNKFVFNDAALAALESSGCLPEEHYSQRGSTSEDACFDKTLTTDISRLSRQPLAIISVDAAQCYDRVNHTMMALVWLALKVPFRAVSIIVGCLQFMKIYTRTGWGDSTRYFGGDCQKAPFCGLGQGSKAAPASWIQLSSVIVNAFKSRGFGAKIRDPLNNSTSHTVGCVFVDDTDLYVMDESLSTIEQMAASAQQHMSWWAWLLNSTGGAIKGAKSFWYLLAYKCTDGIWHYDSTEVDITVPLPNGETIVLRSRPANAVEKTLGVHTAPCGGHAAQLAAIREKADNWTRSIVNGHLPASHVWTSYHHQLWPRLLYAISTLTNDLQAAEQCLSGLEYTLLPQLGVNRHIKKGWRRVHQTFGGVGLMDLKIEQLICRINMLLQHYGTSSALGHKLSVSFHWLQLHLGCLDSPLLLDYSTWSHLSPTCWVKCLWESLDHYSVDLEMKFSCIPLQREGDRSIMEFLSQHLTSASDMRAVNRCRCYLHALFLSDLVSLDGSRVHNDIIWGGRTPLLSRFNFPPEHPTTKDWATWAIVWGRATGAKLSLPHKLGRWLHAPHFQWPYVFNAISGDMFILRDGEFEIHRNDSGRSLTRWDRKYRSTGIRTTTAEGSSVSVSCNVLSAEICYDSPEEGSLWANNSLTVLGFWDYIKEWGGDWMWEMIYPDLRHGFDVDWMIEALRAGNLVGATDGSYDRSRNAFVCGAGWMLMDKTTGERIAGSFSEESSSAGSYRGELLGLCAINVMLLALSKAGEISTRPTITVWCDNKGAVNRASDKCRRIKSGRSCADILRVLRSIRMELPLDASFIHVSSHMDDFLQWEQLTLEQQLNCQCDTLAKDSIFRFIENKRLQRHRTQRLLPTEQAGVFVHGQKITSDPAASLRYLLGKDAARTFLCGDHGWSTTQFDEVGWDWLHKVLMSKPVLFRIWLCKQHSNFCATGKNMKRRHEDEDDRCPNCMARQERAKHLCVCPSDSRTSLFLDNVKELELWMEHNNATDSELGYWLIKYIQGRGSLSFATLGPMSDGMRMVAKSQDKIGWRNLMEGRVSKEMYLLQCSHLATSSSRINGDDWMHGLIVRLLHITHSQWLFRNFTLHDKQCGYKRLKDRAEVLVRIEELRTTDPDQIPDHSKFLLEIDTVRLVQGAFDTQVYWVTAMEAARRAPMVALQGISLKRPAMSKSGLFSVREQIRKDVRDMLSDNHLSGKDPTPRTKRPRSWEEGGHSAAYRWTASGLDDSDRRRKPD